MHRRPQRQALDQGRLGLEQGLAPRLDLVHGKIALRQAEEERVMARLRPCQIQVGLLERALVERLGHQL